MKVNFLQIQNWFKIHFTLNKFSMMKNNFNVRNLTVPVLICVFAFMFISACKRESYTLLTNEDVNITSYLDRYPDQFSLMRQVLERSGTAGYLDAYGKYTLFTPTNAAVTQYLKDFSITVSRPINSVADLTVEEAKNVVKIHLLPDTVATNKFTDGKLAQITLYGQYLQTGAINVGGVSSFIVNKLAKITKSNIRLGNGIIHVIDHVLIPAKLSSAEMIAANPSRYSYFTKALKETGFYDSLNVASSAVTDTTRRFQTVILESDSALQKAGFATYNDFKTRYSKTGNPKSHADSLWLYMAYHISTGPTYTPDIITTPAIYTLAPKEVITTKFVGQKIILNEDEYNGVVEPGVEINRTFSDVTTANGVLHEVKTPFRIKVRLQIPVYWDIAEQPELRTNPLWRGAAAASIVLVSNGASILSGLTLNRIPTGSQAPKYDYSIVNTNRWYNANDKLIFSMATAANSTARNQWIELKTPLLVKGKYKVWVCYGYLSTGPATQVAFDVGTSAEQTLPNLVDFKQSLTAGGVSTAATSIGAVGADDTMLSNGFKRYMMTTAQYLVPPTGGRGSVPTNGSGSEVMVGRLAGTVDIQTTDRHKIRFTVVGPGNADGNTVIDMIHFIPLDVDQLYPRFSTTGAKFPRP